MKSILVVGECMLELRDAGPSSMAKCYAGDVYNTAVYAKRWSKDTDLRFLTAAGKDSISSEFLGVCQSEGINTQDVQLSDSAHLGIYAINTDEHGERSFTYWRSQSAAKQMMQLLAVKGGASAIEDTDLVYFSGITLAILSDEDRATFLSVIQELRTRGAKVAFDPNYRPHMWTSREKAVEWLDKSYAAADIVFPGLEDHEDMLGHKTQQEIVDYLAKFNVTEMVIKCGLDGMFGYGENDEKVHVPFSPAPKQVDSTSAGDSFSGTYLASRIDGDSIEQSIKNAANIAKLVVQHKGAIVEKTIFEEHLKTLK